MHATRILVILLLAVAAAPAQTADKRPPNKIEAVVNDKIVTTHDVLAEFAKSKIDLSTLPASEQELQFRAVLRGIVFDTLEKEAAKNAGVAISHEQLADQLTYEIEVERGGEEAFETFLRDQNLTRDAFVESFREQQEADAWRRVVSGTGGGASHLSRELRPLYDVSVTPKEIRRQYDRTLETQWTLKDSVDLSVIQLYFKRGPREPQQTEQRLLGLKQRLETRANFGVLAQQYSDHPTKSTEGRIEKVERGVGDRIPVEIEEAVFAEGVEEGAVLGPIRNVNSLWLVRVDRRQSARVVPFEEAQEEIRRELTHRKRLAAVRQVLLRLVKEAHISPRSLEQEITQMLSASS